MAKNEDRVYVASTGTLQRPRREVAALIDSKTNGRFTERVSYSTNYLVAARFDTNKARAAAVLGVKIINEQELMAYIAQGCFPPSPAPIRTYPNSHPVDLDAIEYQTIEHFSTPRVYYLKYRDSGGHESERFILATERVAYGAREYIAGYDHEFYKTFRTDRIEHIEDLGPIEPQPA